MNVEKNIETTLTAIIPTYNSEACIKNIIDDLNIINKIKIIISDDGSTDNTIQIVSDLARKYENIDLLLHKHCGVSGSRNEALKNVSSDYVTFIDSDDRVDVLKLQQAYDFLQGRNEDIIYFSERSTCDSILEEKNPDNENLIFKFLNYKNNSYENYEITTAPWARFARVDFLRRNKIDFPENVFFGEDLIFNIHIAKNVKSLVFVPWGFYLYRQHEGSTTKTLNFSISKNLDNFLEEVKNTIGAETPAYDEQVVKSMITDTLRALKHNRTVEAKNIVDKYIGLNMFKAKVSISRYAILCLLFLRQFKFIRCINSLRETKKIDLKEEYVKY